MGCDSSKCLPQHQTETLTTSKNNPILFIRAHPKNPAHDAQSKGTQYLALVPMTPFFFPEPSSLKELHRTRCQDDAVLKMFCSFKNRKKPTKEEEPISIEEYYKRLVTSLAKSPEGDEGRNPIPVCIYLLCRDDENNNNANTSNNNNNRRFSTGSNNNNNNNHQRNSTTIPLSWEQVGYLGCRTCNFASQMKTTGEVGIFLGKKARGLNLATTISRGMCWFLKETTDEGTPLCLPPSHVEFSTRLDNRPVLDMMCTISILLEEMRKINKKSSSNTSSSRKRNSTEGSSSTSLRSSKEEKLMTTSSSSNHLDAINNSDHHDSRKRGFTVEAEDDEEQEEEDVIINNDDDNDNTVDDDDEVPVNIECSPHDVLKTAVHIVTDADENESPSLISLAKTPEEEEDEEDLFERHGLDQRLRFKLPKKDCEKIVHYLAATLDELPPNGQTDEESEMISLLVDHFHHNRHRDKEQQQQDRPVSLFLAAQNIPPPPLPTAENLKSSEENSFSSPSSSSPLPLWTHTPLEPLILGCLKAAQLRREQKKIKEQAIKNNRNRAKGSKLFNNNVGGGGNKQNHQNSFVDNHHQPSSLPPNTGFATHLSGVVPQQQQQHHQFHHHHQQQQYAYYYNNYQHQHHHHYQNASTSSNAPSYVSNTAQQVGHQQVIMEQQQQQPRRPSALTLAFTQPPPSST